MKNLPKIVLVVVVSATVLVSAVTILTPRVVRAAAAMLVQNVDSPARNPWSASCAFSATNDQASCDIFTPNGKEVVIQTITFQGASDVSHDNVVLNLYIPISGGNQATWSNQILKTVLNHNPSDYLGLSPALPDGSHYFLWSASTTLYVDPPLVGVPGYEISAAAITDGPNPKGLIGIVTLTGYAVTLSAPGAN
jgi:hypothetical protein